MKLTVQQRNNEMVDRRRKGQTLDEIGKHFGLTRERVRQIVKEIDPELVREKVGKIKRRVKAARIEESRDEIRRKIYVDWENLSLLTIAQISKELGINQDSIKDALSKKRFAILKGNEKPLVSKLQQFSDAEIKKALRDASLFHSPITAKKYSQLLKSGKIYGPTVARLNQRFGSWSGACDFARVTPGKAVRSYSREWSNQRLFEIVVEFLSDPTVASDSFQSFDAWLKGRPGYPSGQTVRNNLGSWRVLKADALRKVRKPSRTK